MNGIHVRVSEEEEALLQEQAALAGKTVSELVREVLFREPGRFCALRPATFEQLNGLEERVATLTETVARLCSACEKPDAGEGAAGEILALKNGQSELAGRVENAERALRFLSENVTRLVDLQVQEREAPFGLDRAFVQVATMAVFTLARGTFSNNPQAWEPYKEEARRRAYRKKGDPS